MANSGNHLIELLPRKVRESLLAKCEPFELVLSEVLSEPGKPIRHVYFPTSGFISLVTLINKDPALEIGIVGREGMLGVQLSLKVPIAPLHSVVQGPGSALRISAAAFQRQLNTHPALQRGMHRYLYVLMSQMAQSAGCLRYHKIDERLARWLLMSQDRCQCDTFTMTHEFLAYMLGVRRVGITTAAGQLNRAGLIKYRRGVLTVLNRTGLEAASCGCYAADCKTYAKMLG